MKVTLQLRFLANGKNKIKRRPSESLWTKKTMCACQFGKYHTFSSPACLLTFQKLLILSHFPSFWMKLLVEHIRQHPPQKDLHICFLQIKISPIFWAASLFMLYIYLSGISWIWALKVSGLSALFSQRQHRHVTDGRALAQAWNIAVSEARNSIASTRGVHCLYAVATTRKMSKDTLHLFQQLSFPSCWVASNLNEHGTKHRPISSHRTGQFHFHLHLGEAMGFS